MLLKPVPDTEPSFFRMLGYSGNHFYFYSHLAEAVIEASRGSMTNAATLLQIAPLAWWQTQGMGTEGGNIRTTQAAAMLIEGSYAVGLFDHNVCRGRGAWDDGKTNVLHMGDKLIVNGAVTTLQNYHSRYMYEKRLSMDVDYGKPIDEKEAHKLLEICKLVRWEEKISGELLAGWIVIAPISGALKHRPHVYLIGPASSGKSWVMEEILANVLGKTAFITSSKSTAAGIRQALKSDALPVIFDESEAEEVQDRIRLQEIFDMARAAFNGDMGPIHKGTADQSGKTYLVRSCFAFSSINLSMQRHADETRTTILKLKQPIPENAKAEAESFAILQKLALETITPEWRGGLLARTVSLIPTIKANAETFAKVAGIYFGSRRQGDQLGAILAGLYSLHKSDLISEQDARKFIEEHEWPQQKETVEDTSHLRLWKYLQESEIKVDTMTGYKTRTIADIINIINDQQYDADISKSTAEAELKRKGFRVEDGFVWVSNTNSWIKERLYRSEWTGKWSHGLRCLTGAIASQTPRRFVNVDRCVGVPLNFEHQIGD